MYKVFITIFFILLNYSLSYSEVLNLDNNIKINIPNSWIIFNNKFNDNIKSEFNNYINKDNNLNDKILPDYAGGKTKNYFNKNIENMKDIFKNQNIILACGSEDGMQAFITKLKDNSMNNKSIFDENSKAFKIVRDGTENMYKNIIQNKTQNILHYDPLRISSIDGQKCLLTSYITLDDGIKIKHDSYYLPYSDFTYIVYLNYPLNNNFYDIMNLIKDSIHIIN